MKKLFASMGGGGGSGGGAKSKKWTIEDFLVGPPIGRGRYGNVFACTERQSQKTVAIKVIFKEELEHDNAADQLRHEFEVHCRLIHPHILRMYAHFHDSQRVYLVMDYAEGGSLHHFLEQQPGKRFDDRHAALYIKQLLQGLNYVHQQGLIHRDLKPENLLLNGHGDLLVSDFGSSINKNRQRAPLVGTPQYVAPEMLRNEACNQSADMWNVGIVSYELLVGSPPSHKNAMLSFPPKVSLTPNAQDFIRKLLVDDPKSRLSINDALRHQWLADTDQVTPLIPHPNPAVASVTIEHHHHQGPPSSQGGHTGRQWTQEDFTVGEEIGSGHFGCVYRCMHNASGKVVAIKVLFKEQLKEIGVDHQLHNEVEIHCAVTHPHIIKCWGYFQDETRVYLVMDYAAGGELYHVLKQQPEGKFDERRAAKYIAQLMEALSFIHAQNYIHRDLKPENFLLDERDNLLLADFGLSIRSGGPHAARLTLCGTADYLAPEMLRNEPYQDSVDVWSVGVLAYEFIVGKNPFRESASQHDHMQEEEEVQQPGVYGLQRHLQDSILAGELTFPSGVTPTAQDFITKLLCVEPSKRLSLQQALYHPWVQEFTSHNSQ